MPRYIIDHICYEFIRKKQLTHLNWVICREFNKGTVYRGLNSSQEEPEGTGQGPGASDCEGGGGEGAITLCRPGEAGLGGQVWRRLPDRS